MAFDGMNTPEARALHTAVLTADVDAVRYALAGGALADVQNDCGNTPLLELCFNAGRNDEARVVACAELLLGAGANVHAQDFYGSDISLAFAACGPSPRLIQCLLDAGANVNAVDADGWTPLHWACSTGFIEGVVLLLKHGAEVNAMNRNSSTPLQFSFWHNHHRLHPILMRAGASLAMVNLTAPGDDAGAYFRRVVAAGGWANYERRHLDRLTAMLTPRPTPTDGRRRSRRRLSPLRNVPPEVIRRIAAYAFHAGYY